MTLHPYHLTKQFDLLFGCFQLVKSIYDQNEDLIYIVWFLSSLKQSAQLYVVNLSITVFELTSKQNKTK